MRPALLIPWLIILAVCVYVPVDNARHAEPVSPLPREVRWGDAAATRPTTLPVTSSPADPDPVDTRVLLLGKYFIGLSKIFPPAQRSQFQAQFDGSARTPTDRVAAAVVARELVSPDEALTRLDALDTPDARAFSDLLQHGTPLPDDLRHRYAFFADLAAAPQGTPGHEALVSSAARLATGLLVGFGVVGLAGVLGLALLILAAVYYFNGKLTPRTMPPLVPDRAPAYVQAFAVYLVLLMGTGLALHAVWPAAPVAARVATMFLAVAAAFAVPRLAGTPFSRLRPDWGLHTGRGVFREIGAGLTGYVASLPILALGVALTLVLSKLANYDTSHPITESIREHPLLMFFLAAVFAPVTEELFFRGALLSHCRSWAGPFASAGLTAVIFAIIHPQGWPALPVLGSIGFCLAMIRQWRGSLIGPITAHAVHNGMIVLLLLAVVG